MPPGITSMLTASSSRVPGLACRWGIGTRVQCVGWQGGLLCQLGGVAVQPRGGGHAEGGGGRCCGRLVGAAAPTRSSGATLRIRPSRMSTSALNCLSALTTVPPCSASKAGRGRLSDAAAAAAGPVGWRAGSRAGSRAATP